MRSHFIQDVPKASVTRACTILRRSLVFIFVSFFPRFYKVGRYINSCFGTRQIRVSRAHGASRDSAAQTDHSVSNLADPQRVLSPSHHSVMTTAAPGEMTTFMLGSAGNAEDDLSRSPLSARSEISRKSSHSSRRSQADQVACAVLRRSARAVT